MEPRQPEDQPRRPDEVISQEEAARRYYEMMAQASARHEERVQKARKGLIQRILRPGVIARTIGMGILDSHSLITGYGIGDVVAATNGILDLIAAHHQKDRDPEERSKLRFKGLTNIGAALVPGLPASATTPAINAAIDVERNPKK